MLFSRKALRSGLCKCVLNHSLKGTLWDPLDYTHQALCPWDFPDKNTGVSCHFFLQGIFLTQGSNPCLLHLLALAGRFFTIEPLGSPSSLCCSLVAKSCPALHSTMDSSIAGFSVPHRLLKFAQVQVHWMGDAIQPSHPLHFLPSTFLSLRVFPNESVFLKCKSILYSSVLLLHSGCKLGFWCHSDLSLSHRSPIPQLSLEHVTGVSVSVCLSLEWEY